MPTESASISQRSQNRGLQRQRVGGGCTLLRLHEQLEQFCSRWTCCKLQTLGGKERGGKQLILEPAQSTKDGRKKMVFLPSRGEELKFTGL